MLVRAAIWIAAFLALAQVGRGAFEEMAVPSARAASSPPPPPKPSAAPSDRAPAPCPPSGARVAGVTADGKVILNTASAAELMRLPGVGEKRAQAILEIRARLGRFRTVRDLMRVKGIGRRSLERLEPLVVLDPPEQEPKKK